MKTIGIILCLLVGMASCTITKRHYRGGWHIEWKHNHKGEPVTANTDRLSTVNDTHQPPESTWGDLPDSSWTITATTPVEKPESPTEAIPRSKDERSTPIAAFLPHSFTGNEQVSAIDWKEWSQHLSTARFQTGNESSAGLGALMIILGILALLAALFLLVLGTLETSVLVFAAVAGVVGAVLLGSGIALLVKYGMDDSNSNKAIEEKQRKQAEKKDRTEAEWDEAIAKQYTRAVRLSIILAVLFFAILLFLVVTGEVVQILPWVAILFALFILAVWGRYRQLVKESEAAAEARSRS